MLTKSVVDIWGKSIAWISMLEERTKLHYGSFHARNFPTEKHIEQQEKYSS